jgi:uncharacterized OB-fold protein
LATTDPGAGGEAGSGEPEVDGPADPVVDDQSRPWWEAAARGELLVRRCLACGALSHHPRPFCPECWSNDVVWHPCSGRGTLYTWSVVRVNDAAAWSDRVPYVVAMVDLEEGPRLATQLPDVDPADLRIGMAVEVRFQRLAGRRPLPVFVPADPPAADPPADGAADGSDPGGAAPS